MEMIRRVLHHIPALYRTTLDAVRHTQPLISL